jgi:hypothetical protein
LFRIGDSPATDRMYHRTIITTKETTLPNGTFTQLLHLEDTLPPNPILSQKYQPLLPFPHAFGIGRPANDVSSTGRTEHLFRDTNASSFEMETTFMTIHSKWTLVTCCEECLRAKHSTPRPYPRCQYLVCVGVRIFPSEHF